VNEKTVVSEKRAQSNKRMNNFVGATVALSKDMRDHETYVHLFENKKYN
jgi:hypothetical protein